MGKIIVVGSGFSGSVIARKIAEELDRKVIVLEKRDHIAGNMYDETDEHGICIHKYGPHVIVTDEWDIIEYLSKFDELYRHTVKEISLIDGKYIRLPFNFESVQQLIGGKKAEKVIRRMREIYWGRDRVAIQELMASTDHDIAEFANMLFDKSYRTYCLKQWEVPVEKLDEAIMGRVPFAMSYDERYMNKDFQYLPRHGYLRLFQNMLDHPNIEVRTNTDARQKIKLDDQKYQVLFEGEPVDILVYTGAIDELFGYRYGELPYRSLRIEYEWSSNDRVFPEEIVSCPQAEGYTRKTEYKFLMEDIRGCIGSTIATEYPIAYKNDGKMSPFYPVITKENREKYARYKGIAAGFNNIFLCGRLAEFRYYNMDDCIIHAFEVFKEIKEKLFRKG